MQFDLRPPKSGLNELLIQNMLTFSVPFRLGQMAGILYFGNRYSLSGGLSAVRGFIRCEPQIHWPVLYVGFYNLWMTIDTYYHLVVKVQASRQNFSKQTIHIVLQLGRGMLACKTWKMKVDFPSWTTIHGCHPG